MATVAPSTTDEAPGHATAARKPKAKPAPATLVLFVRHGTTPTTGQVLPGRAAGLHLADVGRAEAEAVAERLAALAVATTPSTSGTSVSRHAPANKASPAPSPAGSSAGRDAPANAPAPLPAGRGAGRHAPARAPLTVAAVYASPLERARETAAPIARRLGQKVVIDRGLIEMDFGEWTGAELKALRKLPEWNTVQRYPSGFQFPGGEGFSAMRARMAGAVAALCRRHPGETIVAVSHADPIKVVVSDALGAHLDLFQRIVVSPCSVTAISYTASGPIVLAVNSTGGLADLRPS